MLNYRRYDNNLVSFGKGEGEGGRGARKPAESAGGINRMNSNCAARRSIANPSPPPLSLSLSLPPTDSPPRVPRIILDSRRNVEIEPRPRARASFISGGKPNYRLRVP